MISIKGLAGWLLPPLTVVTVGVFDSTRSREPGTAISQQTSNSTPAPRAMAHVHVALVPLPFESYVAIASDVAVVRILDQRAHMPATGIPYTEYTARVLHSAKGEPAEIIQIRVGGGSFENLDVVVEEAPALALGETVLVFLQHFQDATGDSHAILGLEDGVYRVQPWSRDDLGSVNGRHAAAGTPMVEFLGKIVTESAKKQTSGR